MHELSVCLSLLANVERIAAQNDAVAVTCVVLTIGPLSGVEPHLLKQAWPLAASGSVAEQAELRIAVAKVVVRCDRCRVDTVVQPNRLLCGRCGDHRSRVMSGQEMFLTTLEMEKSDVSRDSYEDSECGRPHSQM